MTPRLKAGSFGSHPSRWDEDDGVAAMLGRRPGATIDEIVAATAGLAQRFARAAVELMQPPPRNSEYQ